MNPKPLRHVDLFSSAGRLEALYRELQDPAGIAVVCHPLTSGGGTLHNKVVFRAARGLEAANVATLRFNFRGAGASGGKFEGGEGEQEDVTAAIEWARKKHPGKKLFVGGFSFGAWVSSRVACEMAEVDALFFIGTPVNKYDFSIAQASTKPKFIVHGMEDELIPLTLVRQLYATMADPKELVEIDRANHLFDGQAAEVGEALEELLADFSCATR